MSQIRSLIALSNLEVWFVFLNNSKSLKSNPEATQELTKVNYPALYANCQYPAGIIFTGYLESKIKFLINLLSLSRYNEFLGSPLR